MGIGDVLQYINLPQLPPQLLSFGQSKLLQKSMYQKCNVLKILLLITIWQIFFDHR